jgi:hypothetical protein
MRPRAYKERQCRPADVSGLPKGRAAIALKHAFLYGPQNLSRRCHHPPSGRQPVSLGADERRPDVEDTSGVLAVDALARAVRFERAFIKQDRAAWAVRQDERDRVSGAPSDRLAGQELAMGVEQDGGRLRLIDIDPDVNAILARPVFDVESAAANAQGGVRANYEDRSRSRTLSDFMAAHASLEVALVLDGDREARALLNAPAKVARAHGRTAVVA